MIVSSDNIDAALFERNRAAKTIAEANERWIKQRGGRMTASSVWQLFTKSLSVSKGETVEKYILEKVAEHFGSFSPQFSTAATTWGHKYEAEAVAEYEKQAGYEVYAKNEDQSFINYLQYSGCTPDGLIGDVGGVQVKCPYNPANHIKYCLMEDQEDLKKNEYKYYVQVQTEMMVTGREWWDFVSYDPRIENEALKLKIIRCTPDKDFQPLLEDTLQEANTKMNFYIEKLSKLKS